MVAHIESPAAILITAYYRSVPIQHNYAPRYL